MPTTPIRPLPKGLRLLPLACVLLPLVALLLVGGWRYHELWHEAEVRLDGTARVMAEHARGVLDTTEGMLERVRDLVEAAGPLHSVAAQKALMHEQLAAIGRGKPQLQGIFVFGPDGRPIVTSNFYPAPDIEVRDRDYFRWHEALRGGTYISQPLVSRTNGQPFFNVSIPRLEPDGRFGGVISVSLVSRYFDEFFADLAARQPGLVLSLISSDGGVFSRTVTTPDAARVTRVPPDSLVMPLIRQGATAGFIKGRSGIDGRERAIQFRQVGNYPLYVGAAFDTRALLARWWWEMGLLALFGLPAAGALAIAVNSVIRRSAAAAETARRLRDSLHSQREMQAALLQSQKLEALGRVTGGVAHDFNNALMVISNSLALLRLKNPGMSGSYLSSMDRALRAATQLTRQLLAFSRRQALVPEQVVLQAQLPGMGDLLRPVLGSRIELRIEVDPRTAPIRVDPAEFELALINLAINARDAMAGEGHFVLRARAAGPEVAMPPGTPGPMVVVEAADTGSGMPRELVDKVFEPFFTTKAPGHGTGLGLSQVYGMCQRAGGLASIESRPNEGTTVRMVFPEDGAPLEAMPPRDADKPAKAQGIRVLVVEDNAEVAASLLPLLEAAGCTVTHLDRGDTALAWLGAQPMLPDVVLTDVVMPGEIDGVKLARTVRERWPSLKVMVMTGYTEQLEQIAAQGLRVLPKPCSPEVLTKALEELVGEAA